MTNIPFGGEETIKLGPNTYTLQNEGSLTLLLNGVILEANQGKVEALWSQIGDASRLSHLCEEDSPANTAEISRLRDEVQRRHRLRINHLDRPHLTEAQH